MTTGSLTKVNSIWSILYLENRGSNMIVPVGRSTFEGLFQIMFKAFYNTFERIRLSELIFIGIQVYLGTSLPLAK